MFIDPVPTNEVLATESWRYNYFTCFGGNAWTDYWTNQPTNNLTMDGVLRKTSSLPRLHHSCVCNMLLQMVNSAFKLKQVLFSENRQLNTTVTTDIYC